MKLCSICDKKIEGKWCKNCHRFVKSYKIPERIYLNESHNPKNDAGCTYHTDAGSSERVYRTQQENTQIYRQSTARTGQPAKPKGGKPLLFVVLVTFGLLFLSMIIPMIALFISEFSKELKKEFQKEYAFEESIPEEPESFVTADSLDIWEKIATLEAVEPFDSSVEEEYSFLYYQPEDIISLGIPCSEAHFNWTLSDAEVWLRDNWSEAYEMTEDVSPYCNYFYEDEEYVCLYFYSCRDYFESDDFAVRVNYDTATKQLHMLGFVSTMEQDYMDLYFKALQDFDPQTEWTKEQLTEEIKKAFVSEEPVLVYLSDVLEIDCQTKDGMFSVKYYPAYTE